MIPSLEDYSKIVGDKVIYSIYKKARKLYNKRVIHINSTYQGGGVAELLSSLAPRMNDIGIDTDWKILHGNPDFFTVTKKFHNALQGEPINFTELKEQLYIQTNEIFSSYTHLEHDFIIIHDPQPLPLVRFYRKRQPWLWRCHIDLTNPIEEVWEFIKMFILRYDMVIVSSEKYKRDDLPVEQKVIHPAIDPLSPKNMDIPYELMSKYLEKFGVPTDKPIITQVSRFDRWKDPLGVIEVFKIAREKVDCRLVLCGNMATDDPEGPQVYEEIQKQAKELIGRGDIILVVEPGSSNYIFINSIQRVSSVVIQKSIKEGFGLTVAEAMWKETPVVASSVGGIPLQIRDGENGFLIKPNDIQGFADRVIEILQNPDLAREIGKKGKETIKSEFLITRLLSNYLDLLSDIM